MTLFQKCGCSPSWNFRGFLGGVSTLTKTRYVLSTIQLRQYSISGTVYSGQELNIDKVLIANRGEIACRVIDTAKKLGVKSVAVYSDADRHSKHVSLADEAYYIGPSPSAQSYLRGDKILDIAKKTGAKAIHPGYGFLSENASFAQQCADSNVEFIGPPPSAITQMGSKSESKEIMEAAGVPIIGGYHGSNQDPAFLEKEADKIGYPVMIKAVSGGGGKGMRIVESQQVFHEMLESAKREAMKSFSDDVVLIEKYVKNPRHVEVQVFADKYGDCVYLFERDCSVQRRHQKIIEEAPAPGLSEAVRKDIGEAAVKAAKAVKYVGAGTVEFIMDSSQKFFFMEMNTRLQVEHPVTEYITNVDLVDWQLQIAAGKRLPKKQEELTRNGHSFEARIYAEDPENNFLPVTGKIHHMVTPAVSEFVRIDTGVEEGDQVSVYYDPMIAKLIVWGENRTVALQRLLSALSEYRIVGLRTNIELVKSIVQHPEFIKANLETGFIDNYKHQILNPEKIISNQALCEIAVATHFRSKSKFQQEIVPYDFRLNSNCSKTYRLKSNLLQNRDDAELSSEFSDIELIYNSPSCVTAKLGNDSFNFTDIKVTVDKDSVISLIALVNGSKTVSDIIFSTDSNEINYYNSNPAIEGQAQHLVVEQCLPDFLVSVDEVDDSAVCSPMTGKVEKVIVKHGEAVKKGQPMVIVEAMKMEHILKAPISGTVGEIMCASGDIVEKNVVLVKINE